MLRKAILLFFLFLALFLTLNANSVFAQTTCDLCGYCQGATVPSNWQQCAKCIYPDVQTPEQALSAEPNMDRAYTVFGCVETNASGFANFFMNFITSVVSGVAFLGIIYGGSQIMLARGDKDKIQEGKRYVYGSIAGLLVVVFSVFIIKTIGGSILKIPFLQ